MMRNILIVEDNKLVCDRLMHMLTAISGVAMLDPATSFASAKQALATVKADWVILDIQLPDGNGIDLIPVIKAANPQATVVMLTNHAFSAHRKRSMDAGADYFLDKSTEFCRLAEILDGGCTEQING